MFMCIGGRFREFDKVGDGLLQISDIPHAFHGHSPAVSAEEKPYFFLPRPIQVGDVKVYSEFFPRLSGLAHSALSSLGFIHRIAEFFPFLGSSLLVKYFRRLFHFVVLLFTGFGGDISKEISSCFKAGFWIVPCFSEQVIATHAQEASKRPLLVVWKMLVVNVEMALLYACSAWGLLAYRAYSALRQELNVVVDAVRSTDILTTMLRFVLRRVSYNDGLGILARFTLGVGGRSVSGEESYRKDSRASATELMEWWDFRWARTFVREVALKALPRVDPNLTIRADGALGALRAHPDMGSPLRVSHNFPTPSAGGVYAMVHLFSASKVSEIARRIVSASVVCQRFASFSKVSRSYAVSIRCKCLSRFCSMINTNPDQVLCQVCSYHNLIEEELLYT